MMLHIQKKKKWKNICLSFISFGTQELVRFSNFYGERGIRGRELFYGVNVTSQVTSSHLDMIGKKQTFIFMQHYAKMMSF